MASTTRTRKAVAPVKAEVSEAIVEVAAPSVHVTKDRALEVIDNATVEALDAFFADAASDIGNATTVENMAAGAARSAGAYAYHVASTLDEIGKDKRYASQDAFGKAMGKSGSTVTLWKRLARAFFVADIAPDSPLAAVLSNNAAANHGDIADAIMSKDVSADSIAAAVAEVWQQDQHGVWRNVEAERAALERANRPASEAATMRVDKALEALTSALKAQPEAVWLDAQLRKVEALVVTERKRHATRVESEAAESQPGAPATGE